VVFNVNGTAVEFVPMQGVHQRIGLKANEPKQGVWGRISKGTVIELEVLGIRSGNIPTQDLPVSRPTGTSRDQPVGAPHQNPRFDSRPTTGPQSAIGLPQNGSFIGVDVGGRPTKGYDLCLLEWSGQAISRLSFASCPYQTPLPNTSVLRPMIAAGSITQFAGATHAAATRAADDLWTTISRLTPAPLGVFIDSPSAFSRNTRGQGRLTEKQSISGVSFQSTPSLACGVAHEGEWGWLVYGMIAFAAALHQGGGFSLAQWTQALHQGLHMATMRAPLVIRECFPTATVSVLRTFGRAPQVETLLAPVSSHPPEVQAATAYLKGGVGSVKQARKPLYDRADALVAALSSLPFAVSGFAESSQWPAIPNAKWSGRGAQDHQIEGAITLVV
jgi:hypothetical protein